MTRKSGEVWISKTKPHTLKYYAGSTEYWATSATTHQTGEDIKKGQVLITSKNGAGATGKVFKAEYPIDLNDVIGIALNDAAINTDVRVLNYGYLEFNRAELENLFITQSDITVGNIDSSGYYNAGADFATMTDSGAGNGWSTSTWTGKGAPVYWYQGRLIKTSSSTYEMKQPSIGKGQLTFATPVGYKYPNADLLAWGDTSFDVSYEHLPIIGNVFNYAYDGSNNITSLILHINFSKFHKDLSFMYPASGLYHYDAASFEQQTTTVRHGLFTNSSLLNYTDLSILSSTDSNIDGEIIRVYPGFTSVANESKTDVTVQSDTSFYGKFVGKVHYIL